VSSPEKQVEQKMVLRALLGEWEDGEAVFLGAVEHTTYEAILIEDAHDDTDRWGERCEQWVNEGPVGVEEAREVDIRVSVPPDLFATPTPPSKVEVPDAH
jgi:hypothetical protein